MAKETEAHKRWAAENTVHIGMRLQKKSDRDILEFIQQTKATNESISTQAIFKAALREYMERHKDNEQEETKQ